VVPEPCADAFANDDVCPCRCRADGVATGQSKSTAYYLEPRCDNAPWKPCKTVEHAAAPVGKP